MPTYITNSGESWRRRTSKDQWIRWFFWLVGYCGHYVRMASDIRENNLGFS